MTDIIVFDLKIIAAPNIERFCPAFSEFAKPETREAKRAAWMADGWKTEVAATQVSAIISPDPGNMSTDQSFPATHANIIRFVDDITSAKVPVVCEHFSVKSSMLLATMYRIAGAEATGPDLAAEITAMARRLYDLRRKALDMVLPFLDGKLVSDASHVHNPIRALRLDDLTHQGLCAFAGLPITATRLTVQRKLAHRIGITGAN